MVEISPARAAVLALRDIEICRLYDDDSESLIETSADLDQAIRDGDQLGIWFEDDSEAAGSYRQSFADEQYIEDVVSGDQNELKSETERARQIVEKELRIQQEKDLELEM